MEEHKIWDQDECQRYDDNLSVVTIGPAYSLLPLRIIARLTSSWASYASSANSSRTSARAGRELMWRRADSQVGGIGGNLVATGVLLHRQKSRLVTRERKVTPELSIYIISSISKSARRSSRVVSTSLTTQKTHCTRTCRHTRTPTRPSGSAPPRSPNSGTNRHRAPRRMGSRGSPSRPCSTRSSSPTLGSSRAFLRPTVSICVGNLAKVSCRPRVTSGMWSGATGT